MIMIVIMIVIVIVIVIVRVRVRVRVIVSASNQKIHTIAPLFFARPAPLAPQSFAPQPQFKFLKNFSKIRWLSPTKANKTVSKGQEVLLLLFL